jgi:hypothetical protein
VLAVQTPSDDRRSSTTQAAQDPSPVTVVATERSRLSATTLSESTFIDRTRPATDAESRAASCWSVPTPRDVNAGRR